jgi:hypothetical protein
VKLHIVENGGNIVYNQGVSDIFQLNGNQKICAPNIPIQGPFSLWEGCVGHADITAGQSISVFGLITCAGVFYCYFREGRLTDVVGFHAPSGTLRVKAGRKEGAKFGHPAEEAKIFGIDFTSVKVVVANGPSTCAYGNNVTREEAINRSLKCGIDVILNTFTETDILVYENAGMGIFGVNSSGHFGEPGKEPANLQVATQAHVEPGGSSIWNCCYLTKAAVSAVEAADDCRELESLRWFRDKYMHCTADGRRDVLRYYRAAPSIIQQIESNPGAIDVYKEIYWSVIRPAVRAIHNGNFSEAYDIYRSMVFDLEAQYLSGVVPASGQGRGK